MPDTYDANDVALLSELREVLQQLDPVPPEVTSAARAAFGWRTVDAELAELIEDSALAPNAGIRGHGGPRLLTFEGPSLTVVVEVTETGSTRRLLGQLVEPRRTEVECRHSGGVTSVSSDEIGRFRIEGVAAGPVSFVCHVESQMVMTSWVSV
jgi:hypothetical protein